MTKKVPKPVDKEQLRWAFSNLRLTMKYMSGVYGTKKWNGLGLGTAQFSWRHWNGTWFLFNSKSHLILATVRTPEDKKVVIRYRTKGRYGGVVEEWAHTAKWASGYEVIAIPSKTVNNHQRQMRFVESYTEPRYELIAILKDCGVLPDKDLWQKQGPEVEDSPLEETVYITRAPQRNFTINMPNNWPPFSSN